MHWVLILAVLLCTTLAEKAPAEAVDFAAARLLFALAAMMVAPALAATMSAVVIRGLARDTAAWPAWLSRFTLAQQVHAGVLVALAGGISYGLAWPQIVRGNLGLEGWIVIDDLIILAPVYVPLLLSWAVFYDVDRAVHVLSRNGSDDEQADATTPGRLRYVLLHARHYLGLIMLPLVAVLAVYDTARWFSPEFMQGPYAWTLMTPLMGALVIALPKLLASLWRTTPLPRGELRTRLETELAACRLNVRDLLVWHTDGRMTNAAVSGFFARLRYVFLTDRLVERLGEEEMVAVLRHEAAHAVRHHLLWRLLLLGLPLAVWGAIECVAPGAIAGLSAWIAARGISTYVQECLLLPAAIALYALVVLGAYCKLLEFEADLFACGHFDPLANQGQRTTAFLAALYKICIDSGGRMREGWLHPSSARRIKLCRAARRDPSIARRHGRLTTGIAWGIVAAYAACMTAVWAGLAM